MNKRFLLLGLLLAFFTACDDDSATAHDEITPEETQTNTDEDGHAEDESAAEGDSEQAETPRANPTETPDDDVLGQLSEGVGIPAGEPAPDVAATDSDGNEVSLLELIEDEAILLFFYRGGWCPFCNFQIRQMTERADDFADRGVLPVAISVDKPDKAAQTDAAYEIPFPVLSDSDLEVHRAFSVVYEADDEEVERLAEMGMNLGEASGRNHNSYAIPGVFIIDSENTLRWAHANLDYSQRPSPDQLLAVIDEIFE